MQAVAPLRTAGPAQDWLAVEQRVDARIAGMTVRCVIFYWKSECLGGVRWFGGKYRSGDVDL